jgi:hypothetical protein
MCVIPLAIKAVCTVGGKSGIQTDLAQTQNSSQLLCGVMKAKQPTTGCWSRLKKSEGKTFGFSIL